MALQNKGRIVFAVLGVLAIASLAVVVLSGEFAVDSESGQRNPKLSYSGVEVKGAAIKVPAASDLSDSVAASAVKREVVPENSKSDPYATQNWYALIHSLVAAGRPAAAEYLVALCRHNDGVDFGLRARADVASNYAVSAVRLAAVEYLNQRCSQVDGIQLAGRGATFESMRKKFREAKDSNDIVAIGKMIGEARLYKEGVVFLAERDVLGAHYRSALSTGKGIIVGGVSLRGGSTVENKVFVTSVAMAAYCHLDAELCPLKEISVKACALEGVCSGDPFNAIRAIYSAAGLVANDRVLERVRSAASVVADSVRSGT